MLIQAAKLELHIGYVYGSKERPKNASLYTPKFIAGARLPHAWIRFPNRGNTPSVNPVDLSYVGELSMDDVEARKYSTLDLCTLDGFALIVGHGDLWRKRFDALKTAMEPQGLKLSLYVAGSDFEFAQEDGRLLYQHGVELENGGGLLVRPDQHILMKLSSEACVEKLEKGLCEHLGTER